MGQSLFEVPAVGAAAGVLEQMAEGQEELRGEIGILAERLDGQQKKRESEREAERAFVRQAIAEASVPKALWVAAGAGVVLGLAALVLALLSG